MKYEQENFSTHSIYYGKFYQLLFPGAGYEFYYSTVQWDLASTIAYAKQKNIQVNIIRLDEKLSEQDLLLAITYKLFSHLLQVPKHLKEIARILF